jgi:deoxyribodipyrimidine photo-lyase
MSVAVVLFSDDFRINDNQAFHCAVEENQIVIPIYIYNENYLGRPLGAASKVFLHYTLLSFDKLLNTEYNIRLIIRSGDYIEQLKKLFLENKFDQIYFNRSYSNAQIQVEQNIKDSFKSIQVKDFKAKTLFDPWDIMTGQDSYFKVFTPFSKQCLRKTDLIGKIFSKPVKNISSVVLESIDINDLNLLPKNQGEWYKNVVKDLTFNHDEIESNYISFVNNIDEYPAARNNPALNKTSKISQYLRFGLISPRLCFDIAFIAAGEYNQFILELLWREFAFHVMYYNQDIHLYELKQNYSHFKWDHNPIFIKKWQKGQTGFPIVDAGMKELNQTGLMHNRVRMITASFLIKDLLTDWRIGEEYFWDRLIDACPAVNPFSWQWVFGSGFDAAPYFRIFNPELQQKRFDPEYQYCNKWIKNNSEQIVKHDIQKNIAMQRYKEINC